MAGDKEFTKCSLDENNCLSLYSVLRAYNAPLSEEQAFAVCFQTAKCMLNEWNSDKTCCYCLVNTSQVLIHKDGTIHHNTVKLRCKDAGDRPLAKYEYQLVAYLGLIIYQALDFGLNEDEERKLSRPLETLIESMAHPIISEDKDPGSCSILSYESSQTADEGIEQDTEDDDDQDILREQHEEEKKGMSLMQVIELCANHLSCPEQADSHYKAVCRALVAEVLELSSFLENISNKEQVLSYLEDETYCTKLEELQIHEWARLWMQVIQQLRQGVKLKKVDPSQIHHPIEYALTPYEMLLDDIRSRRYKLNQVMVNGDIPPRVKKDAHALILEFIRSRPPLVPVSERKLPPTPPKTLTLYEKLMASIKQQHKLKPTVASSEDVNSKRQIETSRTKLESTDETPQPQRRLIKVDKNFCSSSEDLDDIPQTPLEDFRSLPPQNESTPISALVKSVSQTDSLCSERRHSISVCESPPKSHDHTPQARPITNGHFSKANAPSSQLTKSDYWKSIAKKVTQSPMERKNGCTFYSQWQSLESLSLTLEEVVHIRNVLTKADLESLSHTMHPDLYEDICKGKVCFTCKEVRFSFFGPWGVKCKMCQRTVCDKCSSKMHIPTEHFARIPVYMLSPTQSPPPEEGSSLSFWKFSEVFENSTITDTTLTNTPSIPKLSRQKTTIENGNTKRCLHFPQSESVYSISNKKKNNSDLTPPRRRPPMQRSKTIAPTETVKCSPKHEDKLKRPLVPVCKDCKIMVCDIITASQDKLNFEK